MITQQQEQVKLEKYPVGYRFAWISYMVAQIATEDSSEKRELIATAVKKELDEIEEDLCN